jgi:hypothetical protein
MACCYNSPAMSSDQLEYLKLGIALISGGAVGAIITAVVGSYKGRIQPVRYQTSTVPIFARVPKTQGIETLVVLRQNDNDYPFTNLYFTELSIVNAGNQDIKEFTFGNRHGRSC